ncbi:MAG: DNA polymerase IV [Nitrospirae bacterium]|nr:DNA polymerase IV [Candidatus Manganitrophaceae bacterium]
MILHVDMDAFYASIEERERPELKGKPVIVGGSPERRGVVAAANYKAREFGVHSAMPSSKAFRLCPAAIFLPSRIDYYAAVSEQIHQILQAYTPLIEPISLDEAFLDITASEKRYGGAESIGKAVKQKIKAELRLIASVGIAPNKFVAKVASDLGKPDGFVVVRPEEVQAFLDPLPVGRLWGVGKVTGRLLQQKGIDTIQQLRQQPPRKLHDLLGKWGDHLWELAHGRDDRAVLPDQEAKSISHETTFETDHRSFPLLRAYLVELTEQVARRLRRHGLRARTVEVKIRFADFKTITRSHTLPKATQTTQDLVQAAVDLLKAGLPEKQGGVRLIGMGVSQLAVGEPAQGELFLDEATQKQRRLDAAADLIASKYGESALKRGGGMPGESASQSPTPKNQQVKLI